MLTDNQCNEFRQMRGSFNDMVRAIHEAGRLEVAIACLEVIFNDDGPDNLTNAADSWKNGMANAAQKISEHFNI